MGFNIKSVSDSLIHADIRGSVSVINSSDLSSIIDLARRTVESENALIDANKRITELENELNKIRGSNINVTVNENASDTDDNGFEAGKEKYREDSRINRVKIIALATKGIKLSDIIDSVSKDEKKGKVYSKSYVSSVYSPKTEAELDSMVCMCAKYQDKLEGVSLDDIREFLYSRYKRKINRRGKQL